MALHKHHVITNKQCQQLIVELEGKTYEERLAIYLSYGFREDELGGGELDEETWKKIQTIISASSQEKETVEDQLWYLKNPNQNRSSLRPRPMNLANLVPVSDTSHRTSLDDPKNAELL